MDREFMKEFGENMYEDLVGEVLKDNTDFQKLKNHYLKLDNAFYQKIRHISPSLIAEYEELTSLFAKLESVTYMAIYLKGAEDRERMLR